MYLFSLYAFVLRFVQVYVIDKLLVLVNEICSSRFIVSGITKMFTWKIMNFTKYEEERHRKLREDTIPGSELRLLYP